MSPAAGDFSTGGVKGCSMSREQDNKAIVGRWFTEFWGDTWNPKIVDELAAPDILLQYSLHEPRRGRADVKAFMTAFREAFPNLSFAGAADLIAEGDYVVGRWVGGGTHTGQLSATFCTGPSPRLLAGRCGSPARPYSGLRTARSKKRSVWTMG